MSAIAADWGVGVKEAVDRLQPAGAIYWTMDEPDVQRVLSFPHTMIGSDGLPHDFHPHPRLWGTFPRVLGHYCRELGLFPLEEAVRRITGLPAARFGLSGRGASRRRAPMPTSPFSTRRRSSTARRSRCRPPPPPASSTSLSTAGRCGPRAKPSGERPGRALRRQQMRAEAI